jgi:hypothetical protein
VGFMFVIWDRFASGDMWGPPISEKGRSGRRP